MGSIPGFREVVKNLQHQVRYDGLDEDGNAVYTDRKMPTIRVQATEKIHGTNAAVCFSRPDGFWVQSRKNIITPEKDNAACAFAAMANQDAWLEIIYALADEYNIDVDKEIITVYFEWCGGNIQKNACVSGLDKMAVIFKYFKVSPIEPQTGDDGKEVAARWLETKTTQGSMGTVWESNPSKNIFNVTDFPSVGLEIDFNEPQMAVNEMIKLTEEVEDNSGIAKAFNVPDNIGEGWVWTFVLDGNRFIWKTKGEKHAGKSKVKVLKPVDEAKEKIKIDFVNNVACQAFRLDQMFTEVKNSEYNGDVMKMSMKDIGIYLRLIHKDIIKEHSDELMEKGLEPKAINGMVSKVAKDYFINRLNEEQM